MRTCDVCYRRVKEPTIVSTGGYGLWYLCARCWTELVKSRKPGQPALARKVKPARKRARRGG